MKLEHMVLYFNLAIILIVVSGVACFVVGVISLINGFSNKGKIGKGLAMSIAGVLISILSSYVLSEVLIQEAKDGDSFLFYGSWVFTFIILPIVFIILLIVFVFFLIMGIVSLQEGYKKDENNKRDVTNIVLGYIMLGLAVIIIVSATMLSIVSLHYFRDSLKSINKGDPSSEPIESLINYLFYIARK